MNPITHNLERIKHNITLAKQAAQRAHETIKLVAVSKTKPISDIELAITAGHFVFGENYVQEGVQKIQFFKNTRHAADLEWHFIGPLQSNKSKLVAEHFDWIHTVDSQKLIARLAAQRPEHLAKLNVLIQVNISQEESKSGVSLDKVDALAQCIMNEERLHFRGLMAIPAPLPDTPCEEDLNHHFLLLSQLKDKLEFLKTQYRHHTIDTLSMGMSDDLAIAIKAGSTMVRIGSAIFGQRDANV